MRPPRFAGAVLTGGQARRMGGVAKALVTLGGQPLAGYPLAALREAGAVEVLAVGGTPDVLAALGRLGFRPVADAGTGRGPVEGIVAALGAARAERVVVVACDMPGIGPGDIKTLVEAGAGQPGAVVVAVAEGRRQPLLAAYPKTAGPHLERALAGGRASVLGALEGLTVVEVELGQDGGVATNVNTPAELERAELSLRRRSTWPAGGGR